MPTLEINLDKIRNNSKNLVTKARNNNLNIMGVTKACLGSPQIAKAMAEGGIKKFGDSRLSNIKRLKEKGFSDLSLIRQPSLKEAEDLISLDINVYVSTLETVRALSSKAVKSNVNQAVTMMIETGDCRDGFLPEEFSQAVKEINSLPNMELKGFATNIACAREGSDVLRQMNSLSSLIRPKNINKNLIISGANSSAVPLLNKGKIPVEINEIRTGEAILLGQDTISYQPIEELCQDAFVLTAEVLEIRNKCGRLQTLINVGSQDIGPGNLKPLDFRGEFIKSTSDHSIFQTDASTTSGKKVKLCPQESATSFFTERNPAPKANSAYNRQHNLLPSGARVKLIPSYYALVALITSPFIEKAYTL